MSETIQFPIPGRLDAAVPHLDAYFGPWAIEPGRFNALADHVRRMDLELHVRDAQAAGPQSSVAGGSDYEIAPGGVAIIPISGPMMKFTSSLSEGTSTVRVRRQVRDAAANEAVRAIVLLIDSPGGTVAGTSELAREVRQAAAAKPIHAQVDDLCASAAYWVAAQCGKVFANKTAMVGSIGTYAVVHDLSKAAELEGVTVHVIRAGAFKGAGEPGTVVTDEQLAEWQRLVHDLNSHFLADVGNGRKLSADAVLSLADGRVHVAEAAASLKLIDGVQTLEETLSFFSSKNPGRSQMTEQNTTPVAATPAELKAALPGADAAFLFAQMEAGATVPAAMRAWIVEQQTRLDAATAEAAQAKADAERARTEPAKKVGVKTLEENARGGEPEGDAVEQFHQAVAEKVAAGMERSRAVVAVAESRPDLHEAYLLATNPGRKAQRLIGEKFGG